MALPLATLQGGRHVAAFKKWMSDNVLYAVTDEAIEERTPFVPIPDARAYLAYQGHSRLDELLFELFEPHVPPTDAGTILSDYVAVFCILIEIGNGTAISEFVNRDWNDHHLPSGPNYSKFPAYGGDFHQRFCDVQMKFCVPSFSKNMHRDFDEKRILPIIKMRKLPDQGGDGTVYEIGIHSLYNKLHADVSDPRSNTFALKRYTFDAIRSYDSEIEAFRRLHQVPNTHLIGFYGNYTQGNSYNILLEWADQGSLERYFQKTTPPSEEGDILNFWSSLFGIFKALHSIHHSRGLAPDAKVMNGWHQDVKPKNILVVSNGAALPYEFLFKLGDFGLAHFHASVDDGGSSTADDAFGTQTYGAPECFHADKFWDESPRRVKQRADIWSFGCVLSEAAVWVVKGYEAVLRYRDNRRIETESISKRLGDSFHDGHSALSTVWDWHNMLITGGALRAGDRVTPAVLTMIKEDMLRDSDDRLDPGQLSGRAKRMLDEISASSPLASTAQSHDISAMQPSLPRRPRDSTTSTNGQQRQSYQSHSNWNTPQTPPKYGQQHASHGKRYSDQTSPIMPEERVEEPDRMSMYSQGTFSSGILEETEFSTPNRAGRSASQPKRTIDRPNHKKFSSDPIAASRVAQHDAAGNLLHRDSRPSSTFGGNAGAKGKEPIQDSRTSTLQSSTMSLALPHNLRTTEEQYNDREVYYDGDEEDDLHRGQYSGDVERRRSTRTQHVEPPPQIERLTSHNRLPYSGTTQPFVDHDTAPTDGRSSAAPLQALVKKTTMSKRHVAAAKLPVLPMVTAIAWRDWKKENEKLINKFRRLEEVKLPGKHLLGRVGKRDHVFIIDDADSMRPYWDEVCRLFSILAYIVKKSDEDGIEVLFTMSTQIFKSKNVTSLVKIIRKRKEDLDGSSNINLCLGKILTEYDQELRREYEWRRVNAFSASAEDKKPLSVYVFTNGQWGPKANPTRAIKNIVESLVELRCQPSKVGIQFISFGNDRDALARLDHYDNGLNLELDIVDHTRSGGNLWKMVLGAIDEEWDPVDEPDDPGTE